MATTYQNVVDVFESTFTEKVALNDDLIKQWFKMAVGEFSIQIEPIYYDENEEIFVDADGDGTILNQTIVNILGYTIKRYYCEREYNKIVKRSNIITKDLSINNSEGDKRQAKTEIDWVNFKIIDFYEQLKPTAYNQGGALYE